MTTQQDLIVKAARITGKPAARIKRVNIPTDGQTQVGATVILKSGPQPYLNISAEKWNA